LSWWEKYFRCLFISASNMPGCLMPGRIGLSRETPSPYLPDPDQRLPGFARAALLKNVNNYRGCNPGNPRKDRPKRDCLQLPKYVGPLWAERGRSEEHTSELQSRVDLVCRLLLEKKKST